MSGGSADPHIAPYSFSFRLACYSEFHWTYNHIKTLPPQEAELLAIYLEESARHAYKQRKESERQQQNNSPASRETTVLDLSDPDEEEYEEEEE